MSKIIKKLSALDATFLYMETPEMPMHVAGLEIFKKPADYQGDVFEAFRTMLAARIHLAPIFKWKLTHLPLDLDHPAWIEDEEFSIDRHVFRAVVPPPGDMKALEAMIGRMHGKLLDRGRPLWEFYLIEGLEGDRIAFYPKIHHACIDGGAGAALTAMLFDITPEPRQVPPPKEPETPRQASPLGNFGDLLVTSFEQMLERPLKLAGALPEVLKSIGGLLGKLADPATLRMLSKLVAPASIINGQITAERAYSTVTLPLSRVKKVAEAGGGKLNDAVMAVCSGALRQYLLAKQALPKQAMTAFVPISTREAGNADTNNQVFGMICRLATNVEDPVIRFKKIIEDAGTSKELSGPIKPLIPVATDVSVIGGPMIAQVLALAFSRSRLSDLLPPPMNVVISNVPGPRMKLYGAGFELEHLFPVSIPSHGVALNITVQSYMDNLDFGLIAGANVVPDTDKLAVYMVEALAELERGLGLAA